jgi:hypothetical protein
MISWTFFYTGQIYNIAMESYKKSIPQTQQNKPCDDALVAIIFSVLTLESAMSQMIDMAKSFRKMSPKIDMFADFLDALEDARINLKDKYFFAHWLLCGKKPDRGTKLYQDFSLLIDIRNALVHLKPDKIFIETKVDKILKELNKRRLLSKGFLPPHKSGKRTIWVPYISNSNVAKWACNTAVSMLEEFRKEPSDKKVKQFFKNIAGMSLQRPD